MPAIRTLIDSDAVRTAAISAVVATFGWAGHTALELRDHNAQLRIHDAQIRSLTDGQNATRDSIKDVGVAIARVEGKVDTVNQKIDDDRATRHR